MLRGNFLTKVQQRSITTILDNRVDTNPDNDQENNQDFDHP